MGEITGFRKAREGRRTSSSAMPRARSRARCGSRTSTGSGSTTRAAGRRRRGRDRRRARLLPRQRHLLALVQRSASPTCASPARATCSPGSPRFAKQLEADGLFRPQKELARPLLPKTIGVVTARGSAACQDLLAGLERRGWRGTMVWADAPVQDRRAAPAIASALRGLAEQPSGRGRRRLPRRRLARRPVGVLRRVALPHRRAAAAAGDQRRRPRVRPDADRRRQRGLLLDPDARGRGAGAGRRGDGAQGAFGPGAAGGARAVPARSARAGSGWRSSPAAPERTVRDERARLHQMLREVRASATRRVGERARAHLALRARRLAQGGGGRRIPPRPRRKLAAFDAAVRGHDPQRTLERGYALVESEAGDAVTSAEAARAEERVRVRFADDAVRARIEDSDDELTSAAGRGPTSRRSSASSRSSSASTRARPSSARRSRSAPRRRS